MAAHPGPGIKIKISEDGGTEPAWTHGGREVIYRSGTQFFSAEFLPGPPPSAGQPVPLFSGDYFRLSRQDNPRQYDFSVDGNEFVVVRVEKTPEIVRHLVARTGAPAFPRASFAP